MKKITQQKTFRVLVIDDLVCRGREGLPPAQIQNAVTNYLFCLAKKAEPECWVEVCYVATPEEGVARWTQEVFDLTLVDSDFKVQGHDKKDDSWKRSFLDIDVQFKGAYLFRFLSEMLKGNNFSAYRKGCKIALWTGLKHDKDEEPDRAQRILALLAESKDKVWFVPKDEEQEKEKWNQEKDKWANAQKANAQKAKIEVRSLGECVRDCFLQKTTYNAQTSLARLATLYKTQTPKTFAALAGLGTDWVEHGYLVADRNGQIEFRADLPAIGEGEFFVELSPRIRQVDWSFKSVIKEKKSDKEVYSDEKETEQSEAGIIPDEEVAKYLAFDDQTREFLKVPGGNNKTQKGHIVAAATPLTGCSAVGRERAIGLMAQKVEALLNGPFDKVVLKTVYLDSMHQWKNVHWPLIQAQNHHQARCLRSIEYPRTLWNTGITALEAFTPEMMNACLEKLATNRDLAKNIIVSLGSKFPQSTGKRPQCDQCLRDPKQVDWSQCRLSSYRNHSDFSDHVVSDFKKDLKEIWKTLFETVFKGIDRTNYPVVEINVRHYLRECVSYHLGGHEYLSPAKTEEHFSGCYATLDREFCAWVDVLCEVAKSHEKRLLFKLPFRGDDFHWIRLIHDKAQENKTIAGVTLINAFKSGVCEPQNCMTYSPAWYGRQDAWGDASDKEWKYQMSGELLTASRNELLGEVLKLARMDKDFQVHLSGGIVRGQDFREWRETCCVQLGTWTLLDLNLGKQQWDKCLNVPPSIGVGRPQVDDTKCKGCGRTCSVCASCPQGAFKAEPRTTARIDLSKCVDCKVCLNLCPHGAVVLGRSDRTILHEKVEDKREPGLKYRIAFCLHELCNGCGRCSRTFYCDTFLDRRGLDLPPVMDSRNCTGCGLCAQTCPRGAIQLFDPQHVVILIASSVDLLSSWRSWLSAHEIPHLIYTEDQITDAYKTAYGNTATPSSVLDQWKDIVTYENNNFLEKCLVLRANRADRCEVMRDGPESLKITDLEGQPHIIEIRKEVNRRLANLRP